MKTNWHGVSGLINRLTRFTIKGAVCAAALAGFTAFGSPPKVAILQPEAGATFRLGATVHLSAQAQDEDGFVRRVEFFANGRSLGVTEANPLVVSPINPFQLSWTPQTGGDYELTAEATDNAGETSRSAAVTIKVVRPVVVPVVSIVASEPETVEPSDNTRIRPGRFTLRREPADGWLVVFLAYGGTATMGRDYAELPRWVRFAEGVSSLDLTVMPHDDDLIEGDETVVAELTLDQPPIVALDFPIREYRIDPDHARARVVIHDNDLPDQAVLRITRPEDGAKFRAPATIPIEATAIDPAGYISRVEFYANDRLIGVSQIYFIVAPDPGTPIQHSFEWTAVPAGEYTLTAKATDSNGDAVVSQPVVVAVVKPEPEPLALIARGAQWKYLDDGSDQGSAWRAADFDDSSWAEGPAELGYGDGDEATVVSFGPDPRAKYITTYFRHTFEVANPAEIPALVALLRRDDGAIGYLNGREAFRSNMPEGEVNYQTPAASTVSGDDEAAYYRLPVDAGLLREGRNVLAVEIHQAAPSSSDISFDLALVVGPVSEPPVVTVTATDPEASELDPRLDRLPDPGVFTVRRSGPTTGPLPVYYRLAGSAQNGVDYAELPGFVVIPEGASSADVLVDVIDDELVEGTEAVVLALVPPPDPALAPAPAPQTYQIGRPSEARVLILDDDVPPAPPVVTIVALDQEAAEGPGTSDDSTLVNTARFQLRRTGPTDFELPVYVSFGGEAQNGEDYRRVPEVVPIPAGASTADIWIVPVDDDLPEGTESVVLRVQPPQCIEIFPPPRECYRVGVPSEAKAVILDNEPVANLPPRVEIVKPREGEEFKAPADILLVAHASDPDGRVVRVQFFANGEPLGGRDPQLGWNARAPFVFLWRNVPAGSYELTAVATDNDGATTKSEPVNIVVRQRDRHATLRITAPEDGARFEAPADIPIKAVAIDPDGYISRVEFLANGERIGVSELVFIRAPDPGTPIEHTFEWQAVPAGSYELRARAADSDGETVISPPVHVRVGERPPPIFVKRELPDFYVPGETFVVELHAGPLAGTQAYAVEEMPPAGWAVGAISHDGVFDAENGKVKFGPYLDAEPRVLTYEITPAIDAHRAAAFSGIASADGVNSRIGGDQTVLPAVQHPADRDAADWRMTMAEVTAYAAAWRHGDEWPLPPNPIPISYVTRAGALWRGGEAYTFDPSAGPPPLWWVNLPPAGAQAEGLVDSLVALRADDIAALAAEGQAGVGAATREFSLDSSAGLSLTVTLRIAPAPGVTAYAVEDQLPRGWTASEIDTDGVAELRTGKVKWGPFFDDTPRVLNYRATLTDRRPGCTRFSGVASFDGVNVPVTGVKRRHEEALVRFNAIAGRRYAIEGSHDLKAWLRLGTVDSASEEVTFVDPESGDLPARFYRLVPLAE